MLKLSACLHLTDANFFHVQNSFQTAWQNGVTARDSLSDCAQPCSTCGTIAYRLRKLTPTLKLTSLDDDVCYSCKRHFMPQPQTPEPLKDLDFHDINALRIVQMYYNKPRNVPPQHNDAKFRLVKNAQLTSSHSFIWCDKSPEEII